MPDPWRWQGRRTLLMDGTTVTMPDTPTNQSVFPQQGGQTPGLGFPIARVLAVLCLSVGAVLNAALGAYKGKGSSEQRLVRDIFDTFRAGDVLLGDANIGSYFFLSRLRDYQIDAAFEPMGSRKRRLDFRTGTRLRARDHVVELKKPKLKPAWMSKAHYDAAPRVLRVREATEAGYLLMLIAYGAARNRPGRIESRARKKRPKQCALFTEPRATAREDTRWRINPKDDQ